MLQPVANGLFEETVNVSLFDTDKAISIVRHFILCRKFYSECSANIVLNSESAFLSSNNITLILI